MEGIHDLGTVDRHHQGFSFCAGCEGFIAHTCNLQGKTHFPNAPHQYVSGLFGVQTGARSSGTAHLIVHRDRRLKIAPHDLINFAQGIVQVIGL